MGTADRNQKTTRITVRLPQSQLNEIEHMVDEETFPNRSEAMRAAIRDYFDFDD